jgi:hypothetical protein
VVGVSRYLRVVAYARGRQRVHLELCPTCGYDYDRGEDRHEHIPRDRRRKETALRDSDLTEDPAAVLTTSELQLTDEVETAVTVD